MIASPSRLSRTAVAGKHVLCEKPFASSRDEVLAMYAAADEAGVLLQEGMWTRFFPAVVKARELLEERAASARRGAHTGPVRAGLGCCRRAPSARLSR